MNNNLIIAHYCGFNISSRFRHTGLLTALSDQNNHKSFVKNKFSKDNQPKSDKDCGLGVHTASNQHNERKFEYYWGYKNHVLVDCITGVPIFEITTTADVADSNVIENILRQHRTKIVWQMRGQIFRQIV